MTRSDSSNLSSRLADHQAHAMYHACIQLGKRSDCCRDSILGRSSSTTVQSRATNIQGRAPHGRAPCQGHNEAGKSHKEARGSCIRCGRGTMRQGHLGEGPVLSNTDKGQPLFEAQGPLRTFHNIHKIDVAIPDLLNLQHQLSRAWQTHTSTYELSSRCAASVQHIEHDSHVHSPLVFDTVCMPMDSKQCHAHGSPQVKTLLMAHSTAQHSTAQHIPAQHSTAQPSPAQPSPAQAKEGKHEDC